MDNILFIFTKLSYYHINLMPYKELNEPMSFIIFRLYFSSFIQKCNSYINLGVKMRRNTTKEGHKMRHLK